MSHIYFLIKTEHLDWTIKNFEYMYLFQKQKEINIECKKNEIINNLL